MTVSAILRIYEVAHAKKHRDPMRQETHQQAGAWRSKFHSQVDHRLRRLLQEVEVIESLKWLRDFRGMLCHLSYLLKVENHYICSQEQMISIKNLSAHQRHARRAVSCQQDISMIQTRDDSTAQNPLFFEINK